MWRVRSLVTDWLFRLGAYLLRCGDALSQLTNVVVFLGDNPNESLSGRSYRQKDVWFWGAMRVVIDVIFLPFQKEHCRKAHTNDVRRASVLVKESV